MGFFGLWDELASKNGLFLPFEATFLSFIDIFVSHCGSPEAMNANDRAVRDGRGQGGFG